MGGPTSRFRTVHAGSEAALALAPECRHHGRMQPLILITGASSGIGEAAARRLARDGARVILVARNATALEKIAGEIRSEGGHADVYSVDAADGEAVLSTCARIEQELGTPDVVINNAGAGEWRFIEETSPAQARAMADAPFFAAIHFTRAFMPAMLSRRSGQLIHVNSPVSGLGWPGATVYMAVRWALRGFHEALTLDLAGTGVTSTHVVFAKVRSRYFENNPGSEERLPMIARVVRTLEPSECAEVLARAVRRPRREVIYPFTLRAFYWMYAVMPGWVRWLAVRTGRRHE
jgi:short-subunit dehydrogenase